MFRKHTQQRSEIFWECIDDFVDRLGFLFTNPFRAAYTAARASEFAEKVVRKEGAQETCSGYTDGVVLYIARLDDTGLENVMFNGNKCKHAPKSCAIPLRLVHNACRIGSIVSAATKAHQTPCCNTIFATLDRCVNANKPWQSGRQFQPLIA